MAHILNKWVEIIPLLLFFSSPNPSFILVKLVLGLDKTGITEKERIQTRAVALNLSMCYCVFSSPPFTQGILVWTCLHSFVLCLFLLVEFGSLAPTIDQKPWFKKKKILPLSQPAYISFSLCCALFTFSVLWVKQHSTENKLLCIRHCSKYFTGILTYVFPITLWKNNYYSHFTDVQVK